jgi:tetratricopeptide (TPR) repeat protein
MSIGHPEKYPMKGISSSHLQRLRCAGRGVGVHGILLLMLLSFPHYAIADRQSTAPPSIARNSSKPASAFVDAEKLIQQGSYEQAKQKIQEVLDRGESGIEGYNLLGIVYIDEKDYANAVTALQHALKLDPNSTKTRNNLGNAYFALGKLDLAEREFRSVLQIAPGNRDGNYNLGLLLLARNEPASAIVHFERVRPPDLASRFNLTRAYLQAGRKPQALRLANELSDQYKNDVQVQFTLGVLLASAKEYKAAELELEKANGLQPETFDILQNLGHVYLRDSAYGKAELALNQALKLKPESAETLYLLAQVYWNQKRAVDALDLLVRANKLAPKNPDIIFLLARVSMSQNYYEDAIPLLQSGLKIAPQRADLHAALGESYFMSGKTEKALADFQSLIALDPSAASYAFMGLAYRHLGRFDEARKYFQDGLKKDPHNASCLFNLGYIAERQGNPVAAEKFLMAALRSDPALPEAILELANLRIAGKKYEEAAELLRKYVRLSREPATGYYKLAMVERSMHQMDAAQRDLNVFQTLSKNASPGPYPYQHLFDYLESRSNLSPLSRTKMDLKQLTEQINKHPDQPQNLYMLAETYLKLGKPQAALETISRLDQLGANDYRTQTGVGVLLAGYHLYDQAIRHFQMALQANPDSDDVKYDLADALFRKGLYVQALQQAQQVSASGQKDDSYLSLLGDIYAHLGNTVRAEEIFGDAINRNPDNDQYYLSLALVELRAGDLSAAKETLHKGLARVPGSGKLAWGQGIVSVLDGNTTEAAAHLERAVDLLPEWSGGYSALGVLYFQTGQIAKAREALDRLKASNASTGFNINGIEQALASAPENASSAPQPMSAAAKQQFLQLALLLADRTL